jgi:hypothetical protein
MPARCKCPLCDKQRLTIFDDYTLGGQWHYCWDCHTCGDNIELAAKCWDVDIPSAIAKLEAIGCEFGGMANELGIHNYRNVLKRREEINSFWTKATDGQLFKNADATHLLNKLYLRKDIPLDWRAETIGRIIGVATREAVESLFYDEVTETRHRTVTGKRVLVGSRWKDVLVLPFYDMPGRIGNFQFIGRNCNPESDFIFKSVTWSPAKEIQTDAGLFYHPALLGRRNTAVLIAMRDLGDTLKLLVKGMALHRKPMPIVHWYDSLQNKTQSSWDTFKGQRISFWMSDIDATTIRQAIAIDAEICTPAIIGKDPKQIREAFYRLQPDEVMLTMKQRSRHWAPALARIFKDLNDNQLEGLLLQLNLTPHRKGILLKACHNSIAERVISLTHREAVGRTVSIDSRNIEERSNCWYLINRKSGQEELIIDAALRIDKVIHHKSANRSFYRGRILYGKKSVAYCVEREVVEKDPFKWMQGYMIENHLGLITANPSWSKRALAIATQLHSPEFVKGPETVGWDTDDSAFVLPNVKINFGGGTEPNDNMIIQDNTPARLLESCPDLPINAIDRLLAPEHGNALFWACWCSAVANIVAPAIRKPTRGVAVSGLLASQAMVSVLQGLGAELTERIGVRGLEADTFYEAEHSHRWPVGFFFEGTRRPSFVKSILELDGDRSSMVRVNTFQAMAQIINGGWHAIVCDSVVEWEPHSQAYSRSMLTNYLQFITSKRFFKNDYPEAIEWVFRTTLRWVRELGLDPAIVKKAYKLVVFNNEEGHGGLFAEILCRLLGEGVLQLVPETNPEPNALVRLPKENGVFVPKHALTTALSKKYAPSLNSALTTRRLMHANALIGETELNDVPGWLIKAKWLDKMLSQFRAAEVTKLRVVR